MKCRYIDLRGWWISCGHYCIYMCDTFKTSLLSTTSLTVGFSYSLHVCREMLSPNLHMICASCVTDVAISSFTHFFVTLQAFVVQSSGGTVYFCSPAPVVCCDSTAYQDKHFFCPLSLCMNGIFFTNCWSAEFYSIATSLQRKADQHTEL